MKRSWIYVSILLIAAACATRYDEIKIPEHPQPETVETPTEVPPVVVEETGRVWKTPKIALPSGSSTYMKRAKTYFETYANSDEFYKYVRLHAVKLEGGNETDLETAIKKYRECLDDLTAIVVEWGSYAPWSAAIGGWNGAVIKQNSNKTYNEIGRSGFYLHESTHACGFTHIDNDITKHPIITKSWPYQAGYLFEDFLVGVTTPALAGQ